MFAVRFQCGGGSVHVSGWIRVPHAAGSETKPGRGDTAREPQSSPSLGVGAATRADAGKLLRLHLEQLSLEHELNLKRIVWGGKRKALIFVNTETDFLFFLMCWYKYRLVILRQHLFLFNKLTWYVQVSEDTCA